MNAQGNVQTSALSLFLLGALALALPAQAETEAQGRAVFREAGCTVCHAYVAKIGAPSSKELKRTYTGNPAGVLKAMPSAPTHATDPTVKAAPKAQMQKISEWLSGAWSKGGAPVIAVAPAKIVEVPKLATESRAQNNARLEAEAKAKREADTLAKLEKAEKERKAADAKAALKRESDVKAKLAAEERARRATGDQATLKREADEKAKSAAEAKARREAEVLAAQKREADELAKRVAEARAKNDVEAQARLKREAEEQARRAEADKSRREGDERVAAQKAADDLAKREAELKAKREADEQIALKREADERARREVELAKREADAKGKREAEAKAKKDADALAAKSAPAAPAVVVVKAERGSLKAPEKFRDEPCPPGTGAPITAVDEARAKAIMDRIDCTGCHAYVQKKTGPPFKKVFEKVKGNSECVIHKLKNNKEHNDEGVTDELKGAEFKIIADYLATRVK